MKNGSMKVIDYCKRMKRIVDQMIAARFVFSEKELVMCILIGLQPEYEIVYTNYTSRPPLPNLQEVKSYLVGYESKIEQNNSLTIFNSTNLASAFNTQM